MKNENLKPCKLVFFGFANKISEKLSSRRIEEIFEKPKEEKYEFGTEIRDPYDQTVNPQIPGYVEWIKWY